MKTYLYRASNLKFRVGTYCCTHQYKLPVKFSTKLTPGGSYKDLPV